MSSRREQVFHNKGVWQLNDLQQILVWQAIWRWILRHTEKRQCLKEAEQQLKEIDLYQQLGGQEDKKDEAVQIGDLAKNHTHDEPNDARYVQRSVLILFYWKPFMRTT